MTRNEYNDIQNYRYTALTTRQECLGNLVVYHLPMGKALIKVDLGYQSGYLHVLGIDTEEEFDALINLLDELLLINEERGIPYYSNIFDLGKDLTNHGYNIEYRDPGRHQFEFCY